MDPEVVSTLNSPNVKAPAARFVGECTCVQDPFGIHSSCILLTGAKPCLPACTARLQHFSRTCGGLLQPFR